MLKKTVINRLVFSARLNSNPNPLCRASPIVDTVEKIDIYQIENTVDDAIIVTLQLNYAIHTLRPEKIYQFFLHQVQSSSLYSEACS